MPTVAELSGAYENFLLNPRLGAGICRRCFTFIDRAYTTCYPCRLPEIVGQLVAPTRDRYERVLARSRKPVAERAFDREKCTVSRRIDDACVLLVDHTWTTGASAQSAGRGPARRRRRDRGRGHDRAPRQPRMGRHGRAPSRPAAWLRLGHVRRARRVTVGHQALRALVAAGVPPAPKSR
jgi:hypothetical protein